MWSSPRKMESRLRVVRVVRPLELLRGQIPQGGVQAGAVVESLDGLEDARLGLLAAGVLLVVHQLPLERAIISLHSAQALFAAAMAVVVAWLGPPARLAGPGERSRTLSAGEGASARPRRPTRSIGRC